MATLIIGSDHAGFPYKEKLKRELEHQGHQVKDVGTHSEESADYPDFAHPVAQAVEAKEAEFGILICGSGNGVAMAANKHQGIRAALCWNEELASLARQHNNANVICIPARFVSDTEAAKIARKFLETPFEGGRHERRVNKITCL